MTRIEDEARFYDEVGRLTRAIGGARQLAGSSAREGWLTRGLYLFFEEDDFERAVSLYIGRMPFLWLAIPKNPDGTHDRGYIERNAIGLLSVVSGGRERQSQDWLGRRAPNPKISASGPWNVNHVNEGYDPTFLDHLSQLIDRMPAAL